MACVYAVIDHGALWLTVFVNLKSLFYLRTFANNDNKPYKEADTDVVAVCVAAAAGVGLRLVAVDVEAQSPQ